MSLLHKIFLLIGVIIILFPLATVAIAMTLDAFYLHFDDGGGIKLREETK